MSDPWYLIIQKIIIHPLHHHINSTFHPDHLHFCHLHTTHPENHPVEPEPEASTHKGRQRHQSEPAFIQPGDVNTGLTAGLAALLQETSPLTPYKKERSAKSKVLQAFSYYVLNFFQDLCEELWGNLDTLVTVSSNWLLSRPHFKTLFVCKDYLSLKLTPFKTPFQDPCFICSDYSSKLTHFKTPFPDPCLYAVTIHQN